MANKILKPKRGKIENLPKLAVEDGSLIGYKFFYTYSIYNEQDYFKIDDYKNPNDTTYIKGQLIRLEGKYDTHEVNEIANEFMKGWYI